MSDGNITLCKKDEDRLLFHYGNKYYMKVQMFYMKGKKSDENKL